MKLTEDQIMDRARAKLESFKSKSKIDYSKIEQDMFVAGYALGFSGGINHMTEEILKM